MKQDSWCGSALSFPPTGSNGWVPMSINAPFLGGQASVIFRIQFSSDGSVISGDGFAFDDFEISNFAAQLTPFALLSPPTNTILNVVGAPSQNVNISWQKTIANSGNPITYTWLADAPGGNFANPVLAVPSNNNAADTVLTFTYAALNNLLAARGLSVGDTLKFIWTVRATDGLLTRFATAPNFLQVRRGQLVSNVTFKVNMSQEGAISANGVHLAGEMNMWNPASPTMTMGAGSIYSATYTMNVGDTVEYKYLNGNAWGTDEAVPAGCKFGSTTNRFVIVTAQDNVTLPTVCFARCVNCTVGANDVNFAQSINIYPNPTNADATLSFSFSDANDVQISLYNAMGAVLFTQNERGMQSNNVVLNTNALSNGVYFVRISNGKQYATKELVIQK
jgi:hypothetical protein